MNFLQLCQAVARESGTVNPGLPLTTVDQVNRLGKIIAWTAEAWRVIQTSRNAWLFLRNEFSGNVTAGSPEYSAASWSINNFGRWINEPENLTLYRSSAGVADEAPLRFLDWTVFRRVYGRGIQAPDRPLNWTIKPNGRLVLGPVPDDDFVIQGEYYRSAQILSANDDIPLCPADHHMTIVWQAVLLLAEHDEAPEVQIPTATKKLSLATLDLERDQLPRIVMRGATIA